MKLILHIGATKTGSSALQTALSKGETTLAREGVLYSAQGRVSHAHHLLIAAIHPSAHRLHENDLPADREAWFRHTTGAILEEARSRGCDRVVLSSEYCWGVFPTTVYRSLGDAFAGLDVEIILFLRRPDDWAVSSYLQAVKSGSLGTFEDWLAKTSRRPASGFNFLSVIEHWKKKIGAKKVTAIPYEVALFRTVTSAFCRAVGIPEMALPASDAIVNPSPDKGAVQRLLHINRSNLPTSVKAAERSAELSEAFIWGTRAPFDVDPIIRADIMERFGRPYWLALARYGGPHRSVARRVPPDDAGSPMKPGTTR